LPRRGDEARRKADSEDQNASTHNSSRRTGNRIDMPDFIRGG